VSGLVSIRSRVDAAIWRAVDAHFSGGDLRAALEELELELARAWADAILSGEVEEELEQERRRRVQRALAGEVA
jgi:hypothetical protein